VPLGPLHWPTANKDFAKLFIKAASYRRWRGLQQGWWDGAPHRITGNVGHPAPGGEATRAAAQSIFIANKRLSRGEAARDILSNG